MLDSSISIGKNDVDVAASFATVQTGQQPHNIFEWVLAAVAHLNSLHKTNIDRLIDKMHF